MIEKLNEIVEELQNLGEPTVGEEELLRVLVKQRVLYHARQEMTAMKAEEKQEDNLGE